MIRSTCIQIYYRCLNMGDPLFVLISVLVVRCRINFRLLLHILEYISKVQFTILEYYYNGSPLFCNTSKRPSKQNNTTQRTWQGGMCLELVTCLKTVTENVDHSMFNNV